MYNFAVLLLLLAGLGLEATGAVSSGEAKPRLVAPLSPCPGLPGDGPPDFTAVADAVSRSPYRPIEVEVVPRGSVTRCLGGVSSVVFRAREAEPPHRPVAGAWFMSNATFGLVGPANHSVSVDTGEAAAPSPPPPPAAALAGHAAVPAALPPAPVVTDHGNGTYTVLFHTAVAGVYHVDVTHMGASCSGTTLCSERYINRPLYRTILRLKMTVRHNDRCRGAHAALRALGGTVWQDLLPAGGGTATQQRRLLPSPDCLHGDRKRCRERVTAEAIAAARGQPIW